MWTGFTAVLLPGLARRDTALVSENGVEIVRATWQALADGGVDAMLEHVHEEFEMTTPPALAAEPDTYRGHAGVRRWFDTFYEAVDEIRLEPVRLEELGDQVGMVLTLTTRGRSTGLEASLEASALCDVQDDKVKRLEFFPTWDEAVAAAGPG